MSAAAQCEDERALRVESLIPVLRAVARSIARRLPPCVLLDDLIASGAIGLIQAVDSYDPARGASLDTYARKRIRGAILDELRRSDIVPRRLRDKVSRIGRARAALARDELDDSDEAVARASGCSVEEVRELEATVAGSGVVALTDPELLPSALPGAEESLCRLQLERALRSALAELPVREQQVLSLYYDQHHTYAQIGQHLGVTESRVCQIHRQATRRLQLALKDWEGFS